MKFTVFVVSSSTIIYSLNEPLFLLCIFRGEEWEGYLKEAQKKRKGKRKKKSPVLIGLFLDEYLAVYFFVCAFWPSSTGCVGYLLSLPFVSTSKLLVFMTSTQECSMVQGTEM